MVDLPARKQLDKLYYPFCIFVRATCLRSGKAKFSAKVFKLFNVILYNFSANMFSKHEHVKIHGVFPPAAGNLRNSPLLFCNKACPRHLGNVGRIIKRKMTLSNLKAGPVHGKTWPCCFLGWPWQKG